MNNVTRAFDEFKAAGLDKVEIVCLLQGKNIRGQHKAVKDLVGVLETQAQRIGGKYLKDFKCETKRDGDDYLLVVRYTGAYNSQVFRTTIYHEISKYYDVAMKK